jgi:serine phosphatase RsbU (regulator of sigma subunit)
MENFDKTAIYDQGLIETLTCQRDQLIESLEYAKNIQKAIFPSYQKVNFLFPESFVFFLPKDIVSGDFYWIRKIDENIIFTVGDCTGHGVPGAFMSILGIIFLNEITNHEPLLPPNQILNALRERIMKTLNQTGKKNEQKDGMDLTLCIFNEKTRTLEFAGANNPLYHVRNDTIYSLKGDKMPIGISGYYEESFSVQKIEIKKGDRVYLFTDGFADQFGGEKDEKFKIRRFRKLLMDIQDKELNQQKQVLKDTHNKWKKDKEQVDDILVMGVGF